MRRWILRAITFAEAIAMRDHGTSSHSVAGRVALILALVVVLQGGALPLRAEVHAHHDRAPRQTIQIVSTVRALEIAGGGMRVRVTRQPWRIDVRNTRGRVLVQGDPIAGALTFLLAPALLAHRLPAGRPMPARTAGGYVAAHLESLLPRWRRLTDGVELLVATDDPVARVATVRIHLGPPGVAHVVARLGTRSSADDADVVASVVGMSSGRDEHFFGLGEQFGSADARGRRVGMLVQDGITTDRPRGGYAPVPFFVSSRGYGFYLGGTRPSTFALDTDASQTWQVRADTPAPSWYVFDGPRPADIIARYADLTGHPPMPPPWALGVWKTLLGGQRRVLADARRLRAAHIPVNVIWTYDAVDERVALGWPYHNFQRIPPGPYPALPAFTDTLHRLGYKVLGYLSPEFTPTRPSFAYPAAHGYFVHASGGHIFLLDLTNPAALRWWQGNLRHILVDLGFDGWLQDLGDRLPPEARFADGRTAGDLANLYPLLYAKASAAVTRTTKPDALFVMRAGVPGIQQYQQAVWAGDQRATWDRGTGFPAVIPAGLSWGIAQAPFWGSDIGGYLEGRPPLSRAAQEELYLRWVEFGALSPIMRDTLGDKGLDAIYMDSDARTLDAFRAYAELHQQLFPYLYAAARTVHLTGLPIMRHLFLAYPSDTRVYRLDDEYLLGPNILVAPVTAPNARGRSVYLPPGVWVEYWTGRLLTGGRAVDVAAPLERIPLFVRGGALLPLSARPGDTLAPATDRSVRPAGDDLVLRLYPGGPGDSAILADGTRLAYHADSASFSVRIQGVRARSYQIVASLRHVPTAVRWDGRALPQITATAPDNVPGWRFDARRASLRVMVRAVTGYLVVQTGFH